MGFLFAPSRSSNRSIDRKGHDARQPACGSSSPVSVADAPNVPCRVNPGPTHQPHSHVRDSRLETRDSCLDRHDKGSNTSPPKLPEEANWASPSRSMPEPLNARPSTLDPSCRCNRPDLDQIIIVACWATCRHLIHTSIPPSLARYGARHCSPLVCASRIGSWLLGYIRNISQ